MLAVRLLCDQCRGWCEATREPRAELTSARFAAPNTEFDLSCCTSDGMTGHALQSTRIVLSPARSHIFDLPARPPSRARAAVASQPSSNVYREFVLLYLSTSRANKTALYYSTSPILPLETLHPHAESAASRCALCCFRQR